MENYLLIDFGSTFTKLTAVDIENGEIIGCAKSFTTIETDVFEGYNNALEDLFLNFGKIKFSKKIASSSAKGGLKIVSVGLVPDLTAKASRLAAASAGGKVLKTFSYELSEKESKEIENLSPDIVLLTGGIDGGNKDVVMHNAEVISKIAGKFSVIYAGNKSCGDDVFKIFENNLGIREVVICENVLPDFNKLNINPTKEAIRKLFIKNIIKAKGLNEIQKIMDEQIIPTPLAVFEACEILSFGNKSQLGFGDLMLYDVGGATTDVYSVADGSPKVSNVFLSGIKEPYSKRTVEGDIGMRYSISTLCETEELDTIAKNADVDIDDIKKCIELYKTSPDIVHEEGSVYKRLDDEFAKIAIEVSSNRHCGTIEKTYSPMGEVLIQTGKNLTSVKKIIGTGGAVINSTKTKEILEKGTASLKYANILKPISPIFYVDKKNIVGAMGLLSHTKPDVALKILLKELIEL